MADKEHKKRERAKKKAERAAKKLKEVQMGLRRRQSQDSMGVNQAVPRRGSVMDASGGDKGGSGTSLPPVNKSLLARIGREAQHFHTINQLRRVQSEIWGSTTTIPERSLHKSCSERAVGLLEERAKREDERLALEAAEFGRPWPPHGDYYTSVSKRLDDSPTLRSLPTISRLPPSLPSLPNRSITRNIMSADHGSEDDESYMSEQPLSHNLSLSAQRGDVKTLKRLLEEENSVAAVSSNTGKTLLHIAALHGQRLCIEVLLELGADPNSVDHKERTPLHDAVRGGHISAAEMLVEAGAASDALDADHKTPLTLARRSHRGRGDPKMLVVLERGVTKDEQSLQSRSRIIYE